MSAIEKAHVDDAVLAAIRTKVPTEKLLSRDTPLFEGGLELTSLRFFHVIGEVEELLDIEFRDADIVALEESTVDDLCDFARTLCVEKVTARANAS